MELPSLLGDAISDPLLAQLAEYSVTKLSYEYVQLSPARFPEFHITDGAQE